MKKIYAISFALFLLISCTKETTLNSEDMNGNLEKKSSDFKTLSSNTSGNSCYDNFIVDNFNTMRQAASVPGSFVNSYYAASMQSNYSALDNCGTVIFANNRKIRNLQEVPALPNAPTPFSIYSDPEDVLNFLKGSYYFGTSKNYFDILIEALDNVNAGNVAYMHYTEKMLAISKEIIDLGYGNMYLSQVYHGSFDPTESYIYHGIEILSGKYAMTSDFYNSFFAKTANDYVSYPVVSYVNGFSLMADDDYIQSVTTGPFYPVSINILINVNTTLMYYVTDLSTLMVEPGMVSAEPNQTSVYYHSSTQEFFTNSSMTTHVPNGYYYLPRIHANNFQKNNYLIEIQNGLLTTVLGI
jgi:hypothetical protein